MRPYCGWHRLSGSPPRAAIFFCNYTMDPLLHILQVAGVPTGATTMGPPVILQVSPTPDSSDPEEYFYGPSADLNRGDFAAAEAFFLAHGHTVTIHDCARRGETHPAGKGLLM